MHAFCSFQKLACTCIRSLYIFVWMKQSNFQSLIHRIRDQCKKLQENHYPCNDPCWTLNKPQVVSANKKLRPHWKRNSSLSCLVYWMNKQLTLLIKGLFQFWSSGWSNIISCSINIHKCKFSSIFVEAKTHISIDASSYKHHEINHKKYACDVVTCATGRLSI